MSIGYLLVGAALSHFEAWQAHALRLVLSPDMLAEYDRVAELLAEEYPAIDISPLMTLLAFNTEVVTPIPLPRPFLVIQKTISSLPVR